MDTQQNRKNEWLSLVRNFIMTAALLLAALPAKAEDYVFMYNDGGTYHIMANVSSTITDVQQFSYTTCVWSGTSGSTFSNQGGYLYWTANNAVWTVRNSGDNLTINSNKIYNRYNNNNIYIRYYNSQWVSSTTNSQNTVVYALSGPQAASWTTPVSISGSQTTFTNLGSFTYSASAAYRPAYYTLTGNGTYYVVEGGTPSSSAPTGSSSGITYTWTLNDGTNDDGHVRINATTGEVTYYNSYASNTNTTIKVTATHTASGATSTDTKAITFNALPVADPTGITATDKTIGQGDIWTADNYSFVVADGYSPYRYVTATSADNTIATVNNTSGTFTVTGVEMGSTTITITAYKQGNSVVAATTTFTLTVAEPQTGVSGGKVILNDYEDHSWSYYSDPNCPIRSLSPADVKITYYGNGIVMTGNADYTASSTDFVQPGQTNYTGGAKVNVGGEDENTFIYYKTLERGANTQTAWTYSTDHSSDASRCPYTTIPNPFQVRPTYGARNVDANNFTGWRGFQCWRLKSVTGGSVYSAANGVTALTTGAVVNAETEIYFAPNSEYGMEVELEAVWARAYLVKGNSGGENAILNYGNLGVERNFMTLTDGQSYRFNGTSGRRITNVNRAVTISSYYPNGEAPDGTNNTITGNNNNITLVADTKFENVTLSAASYTLTASGYNLIVGRGCSGSTVNIVRGMGEGSNTTLNYTIRLESGVYNYVSFTAGYYNNNDGNNGANYTFSGANNKVKGVMGSDYDRAKEGPSYNYANAPLRVTYNMIVGATPTFSNQNETEFFNTTIKSGYYGSGFNGLGSGSAANSFYLGVANTFNTGKRKLTIEGGKLNLSLAGGIDEDNTSDDALTIRMKGGTVAGSVYGAAAFSSATGGRRFIFTGGTVGGWIAGGANGTQTTGGKLDGKTFIYFGGTAQCNSNGSATTIGPGNATGGNIFGAGSGNASASATATVGEVDQSTIVIADECMVERNVYGGGNYGYVAGTAATNKSDIYISGGNVVGSVFGGANMQKGNIVNITMKGGLVNEGVYGGSNTRGTISNDVTIQVDGGTVGDGTDGDGIFGGGYGTNTAVNGNVSLTLGASTSATDSVTVFGNVYGGSALGRTNNGSATNTTTVTMNKALVNGNLFGGAYGNGANVNGRITVNVNGGRVNGNVFGGGDAAAYSKAGQNYPVVNMTGGKVTNVFGGGKGLTAVVTGNPQVILSGTAHVTGNVYGGGDAAEVSGHTNVELRD